MIVNIDITFHILHCNIYIFVSNTQHYVYVSINHFTLLANKIRNNQKKKRGLLHSCVGLGSIYYSGRVLRMTKGLNNDTQILLHTSFISPTA